MHGKTLTLAALTCSLLLNGVLLAQRSAELRATEHGVEPSGVRGERTGAPAIPPQSGAVATADSDSPLVHPADPAPRSATPPARADSAPGVGVTGLPRPERRERLLQAIADFNTLEHESAACVLECTTYVGCLQLLGAAEVTPEQTRKLLTVLRHLRQRLDWDHQRHSQPELNRRVLELLPRLPVEDQTEALSLLWFDEELDPGSYARAEPLLLELARSGQNLARLVSLLQPSAPASARVLENLAHNAGDPDVRRLAQWELLYEDPERVRKAVDLSHDPDPLTRATAYGHLDTDDEPHPRLLEAWRTESDPECRRRLIEILSAYEAARPLLFELANDPTAPTELRACALDYLGDSLQDQAAQEQSEDD